MNSLFLQPQTQILLTSPPGSIKRGVLMPLRTKSVESEMRACARAHTSFCSIMQITLPGL